MSTTEGDGTAGSAGAKEKKRSMLPAPKIHSKLPTPNSAIPQPSRSPVGSRSPSENGSPIQSKLRSPKEDSCSPRSSPRSSRESSLAPDSKFALGDRVVIAGVKPGVLRYFGRTHFAEGEWCGIELDETDGKNDGTVEQVRYFNCEQGRGIFAPKDKVSLSSSDPSVVKETGVKREASTERVSHLKHPKTSKLAQPHSVGSSPEKEVQLKFQSKLGKPRAIVKPLHAATKEGRDTDGNAGKGTESPADQDVAKPTKLNLIKLPGKRETKSSRRSGIPQPESKMLPPNTCMANSDDEEEEDEDALRVKTPSRVDTYTALTLAYDLNDSSGSDSDNLKLLDSKTGRPKSLNSSLPDLLTASPCSTNLSADTGPGGEAMSESEEEETDLMALSTISHASSMGLLADDELYDTSLLSHDIKKAIITKEKGSVDPDTLELLERELDDEISGIVTPEHDMSSSTISGKEIGSSPEPDAGKDPEIPEFVHDEPGTSGVERCPREGDGDKMATPSSSDNSSPETEQFDLNKTVTALGDNEVQSDDKEEPKSRSSSRGSSKRSSLYNLAMDSDDYPRQKRMVENEAAAEAHQAKMHNSTLELAKVAVSQYADLVRSAEEEKVRHQARRSLASSRGSSRSSSRDSISSSPAREPKAQHLSHEELYRKLELPAVMAVSLERSIDSSMTLSIRSDDITEEPMEIDAVEMDSKKDDNQTTNNNTQSANDPYVDVSISSVSDECGNVIEAQEDTCDGPSIQEQCDNEILAMIQGYSMTRDRTFTISTISEESSQMEDSGTFQSSAPAIEPIPELDRDDVQNGEIPKDAFESENKEPEDTGAETETTAADNTNENANTEGERDAASRELGVNVSDEEVNLADKVEVIEDKGAITSSRELGVNVSDEEVNLADKVEVIEDKGAITSKDEVDESNVESLGNNPNPNNEDEVIDVTDSSSETTIIDGPPLAFEKDHKNPGKGGCGDKEQENKDTADQPSIDAKSANIDSNSMNESALHDSGITELTTVHDTKATSLAIEDQIACDPDVKRIDADITENQTVTDEIHRGIQSADRKTKAEYTANTEAEVDVRLSRIEEDVTDDVQGVFGATVINDEVLKDVRKLKSQEAVMTESAEAQQLLNDLQAGHRRQGKERPISLISDTSVDTGLGTDLDGSLMSSISMRHPNRPKSSLISSTISIDLGKDLDQSDSSVVTDAETPTGNCDGKMEEIGKMEPEKRQEIKENVAKEDEEVTATTDEMSQDLMFDVRETSTPIKEMHGADDSEPMDISLVEQPCLDLSLVAEVRASSEPPMRVTHMEEGGEELPKILEKVDEESKEMHIDNAENCDVKDVELSKDVEMTDESADIAKDSADITRESLNVTSESIEMTSESLNDSVAKDTSMEEEEESSIKKDEGPGEKDASLKDEDKSVKQEKTKLNKKGKDDKENEKVKSPRGRPLEKKKATATTSAAKPEKPKVLRRTKSVSAAPEKDKAQSKTLKAVIKKDSGKPEAKKAKVGSRIAEYIKSPTSDSGKDAKDNDNKSKFSKNIVNQKKADIISNSDKKVTVNMVRRASAPVPRLDMNNTAKISGPKSARGDKEDENSEKKTIKRNPPKSKWSNIMTQISEKTEKKPKPTGKIGTNTAPTTKTTGRIASTQAKTSVTSSRPTSAKTTASKPGNPADKVSSRTSSVASRSRPAAKPTNRTTGTLRGDEKSPSADSLMSSRSRLSSPGSKVSQTARESTPERAVRAGKRASLSAVETGTSKQLRGEGRRASEAAVSRLAGNKASAGVGRTAANQNRNRSTKATTVKRGASTDKTDGPPKPPGPVAQQEITRLEALCEARTKELNYTKMQLKARITSFEAMTALVKYMSEELNAFECPKVTAELTRVKQHLEQASSQLGELEREKNSLAEHVANIKAQHVAERDMLIMEHHKSIGGLEERLRTEANQRVQAVIDKHSHEVTTLRNFHERNLSEVKSSYEKSLQEKDKESDSKMSDLKKEHELHVTDLQKQHQAKLEEITARFDNIKVTLLDKVDHLRRECEEMRAREKMYMDQCQRDSDHKLQIALQPYKNLPAEIESLKTVIEMRNHEIHDLRRRNLDLETQRDELLAAKDRIKNLLQQKENLEAIVDMKSEYEKQLAEKHQVLLRRYDKEAKANKRLSMDKEQLTWRLSQSEYTMSGSFSGSPDVVRRTISHSPTSPVPNMSTSLPDGSSSILRRKKSPSALAPSHRNSSGASPSPSSSENNNHDSSGESCPQSSTPKSASPREQSPNNAKDKENKTNLKRSGTYDLLDREDLEIDLKQSDV